MATLSNQDEFIKTALRLPRDLHAQVQEAAELAGRSMNAEIITRLQQAFGKPPVSEPSKEVEEAAVALLLRLRNEIREELRVELFRQLDRGEMIKVPRGRKKKDNK